MSAIYLVGAWGISFSATFLVDCRLTIVFSNRAELMKKANGTYFPEEVIATFL